jgi:dephospho-CoA kinase
MKEHAMKEFNNVALVISGSLGAGKTTAAKYISKKYGFQHLSFVEEIWKPILLERGMESDRSNLQTLGIELMKSYGPEQIVKMLLKKAIPKQYIVIDDIRRKDIMPILQKFCTFVFLIYIETNFDKRFPRLVKRDNVQSKEEQLSAENVETETTIYELKEIADIVIINESVINDYYIQIDNAIIELNRLMNNDD